jgi:hypothetical protein
MKGGKNSNPDRRFCLCAGSHCEETDEIGRFKSLNNFTDFECHPF